jgi:predicted ATPase
MSEVNGVYLLSPEMSTSARQQFFGGESGGKDDAAFAELIREEVARILSSLILAKAPSLSRFLSYLVERALEGHSPNEYSIGVDVFRRGDSFDPKTDTIVRVQARRLRSKIEKYYASEGQADPVVIALPKGQYAAVFRTMSATMPALVHDFPQSVAPGKEWLRHRSGLPPCPPLPVACTSFVGRENEITDVKQLLVAPEVRLLTLTGAGGCGKTRLALQALSGIDDEFPGGVYMVGMGALTDPASVAPTIAHVVGLRHTAGMPLAEALQRYLEMVVYAPTLLFLDNFEQVLTAAPLLVALLANCRLLKVLVTSRAVLHVTGEHEYSVPPLQTPDPNQVVPFDVLSGNPAVALFHQRAAAVDATFDLREENMRAVAAICARLDGLPLAIELAAARVKVLPPAAMLARIASSLDLLTSGPRDLPVRQQTLRTTIDWSHTLLNTGEQKLFRRLAVLPGGCTLESAEAVCNTRRDLAVTVLDGISSLVDRNLLYRRGHESNEVRFMMLHTIRDYALEKLAASGEEPFTRRAHAAYGIVLAEQGAAQMTEEDRTNWLPIWQAEYANLRESLDWLIETGQELWALRLATALFAYWQRREYIVEGRERLEKVLNLGTANPSTGERARAAWYAAIFADQQGDFTTAARLHEQSLEIYRQLGDQKGAAAQLGYIGVELKRVGDVAAARPYYEQSLAACRHLEDPSAIAGALSNYAEFVTAEGEHALARGLLQEALSIFRKLNDGSGIGWSLNHLGDVAFDERSFTEASRFYHDAYEVFHRVGDRWGMARSHADLGRLASEQNDQRAACSFFEQALGGFVDLGHMRGVAIVLEGLARVAVRQADIDRALTLCAAAEGIRQRVGAPRRPTEQATIDHDLKPAWRRKNPAIASAIWAEGLRMQIDEAIQYALTPKPSHRVTPARHS